MRIAPKASSNATPMLTEGDVAKVVREELDRSNKNLEFVQGQIDKDRNFYKHLFWAVSIAITFIGYLQYQSFDQMRQDLRANIKSELELNKADISVMKAGVAAAAADAKNQVNNELFAVRSDVQKRVEREFANENIHQLVEEAAAKSARGELQNAIRAEASTQVSKGIKEEAETIKQLVKAESDAAVDSLQPTINTAVTTAVERKVAAELAPVQKKVEHTAAMLKVEVAITKMDLPNENRMGLVYLCRVAEGKEPESKDLEAREKAVTIIAPYVTSWKKRPRPNPPPVDPKKPLYSIESLDEAVLNDNFMINRDALSHYPWNSRANIKTLVKALNKYKSLQVTDQALAIFNYLTNNNFTPCQIDEINEWWRDEDKSIKQ